MDYDSVCQTCPQQAKIVCLVVIPAYTGMDYINHWIPAFAGIGIPLATRDKALIRAANAAEVQTLPAGI